MTFDSVDALGFLGDQLVLVFLVVRPVVIASKKRILSYVVGQ